MENQVPLHEQYNAMLDNLVKDPAEILAGLTPMQVNLWHMLTGIADETKEFEVAFDNTDIPNMQEELGDLFFYTSKFIMLYTGFTPKETFQLIQRIPACASEDLAKVFTDAFGDAKKAIIYNKSFSETDRILTATMFAQTFKAMFSQYWRDLTGYSTINVEFTQEEELTNIIQLNMDKLVNGTNARYKSGTYSDSQANTRADKA